MEDTRECRNEALTLLNNGRKEQGLKFTLELPKEREKEFKKVAAGVDLDGLMQIEHIMHPILEEDPMNMMVDRSDLGQVRGEVLIGGFGSKKGGRRYIRRGKKKSTWLGASGTHRGELPQRRLFFAICH